MRIATFQNLLSRITDAVAAVLADFFTPVRMTPVKLRPVTLTTRLDGRKKPREPWI